MAARPRLIFFPGLAADARLFDPLRARLPEIVVPPWIEPRADESLDHYASRLAGSFPVTRPYALGGVSFGGMVALELARYLQPEAVVLIASCRDRRGITRRFVRQAHLGRFIPAPLLRLWIGGPGARRFARREGLTPEHATLLRAMARAADCRFLRWAALASSAWEFKASLRCPVFQIHGRHDAVIPLQDDVTDEIVDDGRHLIHMTHADRVATFIQRQLALVTAK